MSSFDLSPRPDSEPAGRWSSPPPQAEAVLLLAYNRPKLTERVLSAVAAVPPKRLYVSIDGPKDGEDKKKVDAVRALVDSFRFAGELKVSSRVSNLGCKLGVKDGIDWFFSNERFGIILEDDVLPGPSFFPFCQELLWRYIEDKRIMKISGFNLVAPRLQFPGDYFFSHVSFSWGWASWARAWEKMDLNLQSLHLVKNLGLRSPVALDPHTWRAIRLASNGLDTWDYQWDFSIASQNGLHIVPTKNLVQNIGFGEGATHTRHDHADRRLVSFEELTFPLNYGPGLVMPWMRFQRTLRTRQFLDQIKGLVARMFLRKKPS